MDGIRVMGYLSYAVSAIGCAAAIYVCYQAICINAFSPNIRGRKFDPVLLVALAGFAVFPVINTLFATGFWLWLAGAFDNELGED